MTHYVFSNVVTSEILTYLRLISKNPNQIIEPICATARIIRSAALKPQSLPITVLRCSTFPLTPLCTKSLRRR